MSTAKCTNKSFVFALKKRSFSQSSLKIFVTQFSVFSIREEMNAFVCSPRRTDVIRLARDLCLCLRERESRVRVWERVSECVCVCVFEIEGHGQHACLSVFCAPCLNLKKFAVQRWLLYAMFIWVTTSMFYVFRINFPSSIFKKLGSLKKQCL